MQTAQLKRLLEEEGAQVALVATNAAYSPAWVGGIPGLRALFRLVPYLLRLWKQAGSNDCFHLMANSGWSWHLFATPVLFLAALRGTPVVVNYRGGEAAEFFKRSFRWVRPALEKAAVVVVPSGFLEQVFQDFGVKAKVVPNIVDRSLFSLDSTPRQEDGSFRFVITRNLEKIYGIETAIRAFAQLRAAGRDARLEVAGSGPEEATLRQLAKELKVDKEVHFLGRLQREDVVALYRRADAMLNPTTVDNMPNSVIEALACGVPVISSDVGGVPFIVEDQETALLVPVGDVQAMYTAMQALIDDPQLHAALATNGERSVAAYDWNSVGPQWLSVYRSVVSP